MDARRIPDTIGRYRIVSKLGEGGMGVVYAAHDDRLDRPVAIKVLHAAMAGPQAHQRLLREARAGARITHPNVCQLYEIGEHAEELFLAMELLEGEPLSARLALGPLSLVDAVQLTLSVLGALAALHEKDIVHRDLKPSNIFLSKHGVKLLDFGLAREIDGSARGHLTEAALTMPGTVIGTPRYMSPEQLGGGPVDARSDLFSLGVVLYEMITGRQPFTGDSIFDVAHAILHDQAPALTGSPAVVAVDRVMHRAMSKAPADRYARADAFAQSLRSALLAVDSGAAPVARSLTRLVVLPFKLLRPDPEIDFLAFSLADAVSSTLSGLPSLVVRSTAAASRFAGDTPDLHRLSADLDVDVVLIGTLLHAGGQLRVSAQLVQSPSGTLVRAITSQVPLGDIFQLQDDVARSIVDSLSLALTAGEAQRLVRDVPRSADAYEFYLRANQISLDSKQWAVARDLYAQCVELDPRYAPAWARMGRCYRLIGKYGSSPDAADNLARGEAALQRALELNPDLTLAHNLYVHAEVEVGRAREAMVRLLKRARDRGSDPELFAGLVHACRYCGLLDASIAAYELARRLDAGVVTTVAHTFYMHGDLERAIEADVSHAPYVKAIALAQTGRTVEAIPLLSRALIGETNAHFRDFLDGLRAMLAGHHDECEALFTPLKTSGFHDPEGFYYWAATLTQAGAHDSGLQLLGRAVDGGFHVVSALVRNPWLDPLRGRAEFTRIVRRAEALQHAAAEDFRKADGPRVLGLAIV